MWNNNTQKKAKTLETTFYSLSKEEKLKFPIPFKSLYFTLFVISFNKNCISCVCMEARSGQNHDNKIALQVSFNPTATAANIMDLLTIFVINKQYLFQRVCNYF